jgi:hypothetical protein
MAVNKKALIIFGIVVAVLALAVGIYLATRPKKADPVAPPPEDPPKDDPQPNGPIVTPSEPTPDGYKPRLVPTAGDFYIVKKGDSVDSICKRAGYTGNLYQAKLAMVQHANNEWVGREGAVGLRLYQRFEPNTGELAGQTWAYKTPFGPSSSTRRRWPVVYVPSTNEVAA